MWRLTNENSMPCSLGLLGVIGFDSLWHSQGFPITLLDDSPVTMAVLGGDRYFATATYHSTRRVSWWVGMKLHEMTFKMAAVGTDMLHPGGESEVFH